MVNIIGKRVDIQPVGAAAPDNSLGTIMAGLGKAYFGDTLTPALKREQAQKLVDENQVRKAWVENPNDPAMSTIGAALSVIDPTKMGRMQALEATRSGGVDSPRAAEILTGLGEYRATPTYGQREFVNKLDLQALQEGTKLRIDDNKLVETQGPNGPVYTRQGQAVGQTPGATSVDQVRARELSAALPTATPAQRDTFIFGKQDPGELGVATLQGGSTLPVFARGEGVFNAQTGERVTEPVSSIGRLAATSADAFKPNSSAQNNLMETRVAARTALSAIDNLDQLLAAPNAGAAVGWIGRGASIFNDVRAQTEAATKMVSPGGLAAEMGQPGMAQAVDGAMTRLFSDSNFNAKAQQLGVQANILRSQIVDLAYTIAKAKDPSGRMSNQDVDRAAEIIGGSLMDPAAGRQVLASVKQQIALGQDIREQEYQRMFGGGGAPAAPAPAAPAPSGPAPTGPAPTGQQGAPNGARQAADGNFYVSDPNRPGKFLMVKP